MVEWISDGSIVNGDFAYLCGALVSGLWVGDVKRKYEIKDGIRYHAQHRVSLTTSDYSYASYLGDVLRRLTSLHPIVREYTYKTKVKGIEYNNPSTRLKVSFPMREIELFNHLTRFKGDYQRLDQLLLRSDRNILRRFLQAVFDAKLTIASKGNDLYMSMTVTEKTFPIISSILGKYGIHHTFSPEKNPATIRITTQKEVDRIIAEIDFASERVNSNIRDFTEDLCQVL